MALYERLVHEETMQGSSGNEAKIVMEQGEQGRVQNLTFGCLNDMGRVVHGSIFLKQTSLSTFL